MGNEHVGMDRPYSEEVAPRMSRDLRDLLQRQLIDELKTYEKEIKRLEERVAALEFRFDDLFEERNEPDIFKRIKKLERACFECYLEGKGEGP